MENLRKLFAILHKWKPYYAFAAVLLILSTFARMLEPKVLQVAIDGVIQFFVSKGETVPEATDFAARTIFQLLPTLTSDNLFTVLLVLGLIYLSISLVRGLSMFASSTISAHCTEKATKRLRDNLFRHIQFLPLSFHSKLSTGEMIQRATGDIDTIRNFINDQVVTIVLMASIFMTAFFMMAIVHLVYALIAIALVPAIVLTAYFFFSKEQKVWKEHEKEQDKLTSIAEENLAGIRVVQAFAKEKYEIEKFDKQNQKTFKVGFKHVMLHAYFWPLSDTLIHTQIAISVFVGGYFALTNQITIGELVSFYTYAIMVTWPMRNLGRAVSKMGMAFVAIERLSEILDSPREDYSGITNENEKLQGNIRFEDVWFKYKDEDDYVLKGISFSVKAGETIALTGPTAAGKSTIIKLLTRFFEPTKGDIYIDDLPIQEYNKAYLRQRIGVVLQKAFLFSTTIKNNIAYTDENADDARIFAAAKDARIHGIMHIFANGYDTMVGEKGVTLSGGQKQRVALARTLLENPDILVLDDTTSAVDTETEYDIQQALAQRMKGITTFVIAHRISAIQHAHQILVLDKGKIIQQGSHKSLVQTNGFYRQTYQVQEEVDTVVLA